MDPLRIHAYKNQAIKKHKAQQLLNDFILYSLTALACTSFCSSPLWYPPFCATFNVLFFFSLPKITSCFFTSKVLFIVGNLIVIFLLGESKFFASMSKTYNDVCHDKCKCKHVDQLQVAGPPQNMLVEILESKACEENENEEFFEICNEEESCEFGIVQMVESCGNDEDKLGCLEQEEKVVEELNKLVEDFIAKINRQRRLERMYLRGC